MMKLNAAGHEDLEVDRVAIVLAERAGPVVEMGLATGQGTNTAAFKKWAATAVGFEAQLDFGMGAPLALYLLGFRAKDGPDAGVVAVGLVLPANIRNWFDHRPAGVKDMVWLAAQCPPGAEIWDFLTGTLGGRLAQPPGAVKWNALFGPTACVLRAGAWTNRCFLEHLVSLIAERTASVWGWTVVNDNTAPLRLVTDLNRVTLDDQWNAVNALPAKPTLLAGAGWAKQPVQLRTSFTCTDGPALIRLLTTCGTQAEFSQFGNAIGERLDQLLLLPGAVDASGARLYATTVRYEWQPAGNQTELTLTLRQPVEPVSRAVSGALLLDANFVAWNGEDAAAKGETLAWFGPAEHADGQFGPNWGVLTEDQVSDGGLIAARVLSPFAGRGNDETAGLYVTRHKGDPFVVVLSSGQTPAALGQPQRYDPAREAVGVTLNDQSVTVSVSPGSVAADEADAIRLAGGAIKVAAGTMVQMMGNLTVERDMVTCAKNLELPGTKKLSVGGDTSLGANLTVAKVASIADLEAGSG